MKRSVLWSSTPTTTSTGAWSVTCGWSTDGWEAGTRSGSCHREQHAAAEVGVLTPRALPLAELTTGEVGYLITGVKEIDRIRVGDTITSAVRRATEPLPGYSEPHPMVYSGLFPTDGDDFERLRDALEKLRLNDTALVYEPETSRALGFGFVAVFLAAPHGDRARAAGEGVRPRPGSHRPVRGLPGDHHRWRHPRDPVAAGPARAQQTALLEEPYVRAMIIAPAEYTGAIMELVQCRASSTISTI